MNKFYNSIVNLLGLSFWLDNVNTIIGIIIGILTLIGIISNLLPTFKKIIKGDKITDEEKKQLEDSINKISDTSKEIKDKVNDIKEDKQDE